MDNDLIQDTNLDLLQINAVEVEYSGIAPINVDNQEHTISLDPSALSSKLDTSAFDEWTATHPGELVEYSAGDNIDITNHVVSGKDWTDEITAASANALNEAVNQIPDVSEFLTKTSADTLYYPLESNPSGYLTAHQDLSEYAKTEDLTAYQEKGDYYSASNPSGFITGVDLSNYYQKNETSSKEEISAALEDFQPLTPEQLSAIESISSREFISAISADVSAWTPWISGWKEIGAVTANWGDTFQVISSHDFSGFHNHSIGLKGSNITLPTTAAIGEALDNKLDLSSFSSYTSNTYNYISSVNALANSAYTTAVNNYYNKADLSAVSSYSSDLTYLSGACDFLSGQTEQKLDATAFDPNAFYPSSNPSGFITGVDLSNYYEKNETSSKEEIENAITSVENIINNLSGEYYPLTSNPSGYLTAHQDVSDKLDVTAFTSYTATADTTEYSAGDGIDITNHVISVTAELTGDYLTKESADTLYQPLGDYLTTADSGNFYPMTGNPSGFLTAVDLSNYYEKNETSSKEEISAALENAGHEYSGIAPIDVNNTTHQISADVWTLSARNGIEILEDSENKVTTLDFTAQPDLSNYYTKSDIQSQSSNYYPKTGNPSGFLTAHQSLSNYYTKNETSSKTEISNAITGKQDKLTFAYNSSDAISSINGSALAGGTSDDTIDLSAGEGISIVETANKVLISNNISAGSNMSFVYDSETNKIRIDADDAFPITATDGNTTWSADCNASSFIIARNTSRTDIGAYGFEYRQAPSVDVSGSWYDLALLMEKFKYAIPVEAVANSGMATGQNILYVVTGS